jgi:Rrf2 family protein
MLLTRASEYALLSLDSIRKSDSPIGAEQLANELCIPKSFLAKILQSLAKQGILESRKGAHGGFILAKDINDITINSIILAVQAMQVLVQTVPSELVLSLHFYKSFKQKLMIS